MLPDGGSEYWTLGLQFLDSGNYIAVNRTIIRVVGLHEAVILGELASEAMQWANEGRIEDGWFYIKCEKLEYKTSLSAHYQREALKRLEDLGIIEISYKGIPRKRYIRINFAALVNVVNSKSLTPLTTSGEYRSPLAVNDVENSSNQEEVTSLEQEQIYTQPKKKQRKSKPFVPPTLEEVQSYVAEKHYHFSAKAFMDYYEASNWHFANGKPVKSWKQCCVTWESNRRYDKPARAESFQQELGSMLDGWQVEQWG